MRWWNLREAETVFDVSAFIYGHRGLWGGSIPENSLAAFNEAHARGIGAELDVRLTADLLPVVFHDAALVRMCNDERVLREVSAAELATARLPDGSAIPTLAQALDAMGNLPALL
jgi:glycerophosphoryl diester phosphodiesterase